MTVLVSFEDVDDERAAARAERPRLHAITAGTVLRWGRLERGTGGRVPSNRDEDLVLEFPWTDEYSQFFGVRFASVSHCLLEVVVEHDHLSVAARTVRVSPFSLVCPDVHRLDTYDPDWERFRFPIISGSTTTLWLKQRATALALRIDLDVEWGAESGIASTTPVRRDEYRRAVEQIRKWWTERRENPTYKPFSLLLTVVAEDNSVSAERAKALLDHLGVQRWNLRDALEGLLIKNRALDSARKETGLDRFFAEYISDGSEYLPPERKNDIASDVASALAVARYLIANKILDPNADS